MTSAVSGLSEKLEKGQELLRSAVESRLDAIWQENAAKLDEMRQTVDEKLQTTLETRLGESFNRVVEHLERVHKGIGEMQTLAANVGDLKNVLTNVKVRGTYGEVQLALLLEQFLSPDQYVKNASVGSGGRERVEYAIKFPADGEQVLLPIDSKFPREDYEHRSSEVWQLLGAIKGEFDKYGDVVSSLARQLNAASNSVDSLGRRTRVMSRKLKDVEVLSDQQAAERLLGFSGDDAVDEGFEGTGDRGKVRLAVR